MSTNYTKNYNLCQWGPGDKVLREDFNADNAKIDAALAAQKTAVEQVRAVTDIAYTQLDKPVAVGVYTGDGAAHKNVSLGFRPTAMIVLSLDAYISSIEGNQFYVRFAAASRTASTGFTRNAALEISSDGFTVYNSDYGIYHYLMNEENNSFMYFAFR